MSKVYNDELEFEADVISVLQKHGRETEVIKNPTEKDLIENRKSILFNNNKERNRLNGQPLTDTEMEQILEKIKNKSTLDLNTNFINAVSVTIRRDNKKDTLNCGKDISLAIYNRKEIAAGSSTYQIVEQPRFEKKNEILPNRRGDLMLLINGMPVIHIELKRSGVNVYEATNQIQKYSKEGMFSGIFGLIQVFVAMTPEKTLYFANPGNREEFDRRFFFQWADFNNNPITDWAEVTSKLLAIPMAHMLIGFYTVADSGDNRLKVLRSYQYYAANAIADKVSKMKQRDDKQKGGYIRHTTGSGKTMTSFKTAQLIASSKDAEKVVFLLDRIELGTQTLREYRGFADDPQDVQGTENTDMLIGKLKSDDPQDTLIVTSIQKMSNITEDYKNLARELKKITSKKIVFIIDECHRDTFGKMLATIKETFPTAIFFGFTGTPIFEDNSKGGQSVAGVFGDELHRYSIADGIRDGNVLGFDPYQCFAYKDLNLKRQIALLKSGAKTMDKMTDKQRKKYDQVMQLDMIKIESLITSNMDIYGDTYKKEVIKDILEGWETLSSEGRYSAILATNSIPDAISYYQLFKEFNHNLKITSLFDPNIDNEDGFEIKEDGLVEIFTDYNNRYKTKFTLSNPGAFKDNILKRFARKGQFKNIKEEDKIDLLIVVNQMLTGFDSKWINTLYLDKVLKDEMVIQAFSRTNRIESNKKPFGVIKYYRKPHTMKKNIEDAIKLYAGDQPFGMFVDKLDKNIDQLKKLNKEINDLFVENGIENIDKLPEDIDVQSKFESLFRKFSKILDGAKIQSFRWDVHGEKDGIFNENRYDALLMRYKEINRNGTGGGGGGENGEITLDLEPSIISIDTQKIDDDYMNNHFIKYCVALSKGEETDVLLENLHKTFANLSQEDQKFANIIINDIEGGKLIINEGDTKTFRDYITEYKKEKENDNITKLVNVFGVDKKLLSELIVSSLGTGSVQPYSKFETLKEGINKENAKKYFEKQEGNNVPNSMVNVKTSALLEKFIISGGFEIDDNLD